MVDDLMSYRCRIDRFYTFKMKSKKLEKENKRSGEPTKWWVAVSIIPILLIIGGIEINPGPANTEMTLPDLDAKLNKITDIYHNLSSERLK